MNGFRVLNFALFAFCFLCFSVGDELGLAESLGNVEANKRRALNIRTGANNIGVLPASKMPTSYPSLPAPIVPSPGAPIQQSRPQAVTVRASAPMLPKGGPPKGVPAAASPVYMSPAASLMTKATSLPLGVPPFRPIPKPTPEAEPVRFDPSVLRRNFALKTAQTPDPSFQSQLMNQTSSFHRGGAAIRTAPASPFPSAPNQQIIYKEQAANLQVQKVPAFQAMPESVSRISTGPVVQVDNKLQPAAIKNSIMSIPPRRQLTGKPGPTIATGSATTGDAAEEIDLMGHTVEELAAAANVSVEVIKEAIRVRQQELRAQKQYEKQQATFAQAQFLAQQTTPATTTTTTTTTPRPRRYPTNAGHKVMNAPKEYYPVGYDKNFDDNFTSKVDLPYTTFNCGEQKHFPGLYGDEDLGCMVFHVCALTDDGLIMKSFLCPESTLFDQTVLKCNWWFYVDCKSSKNLYDSNLPVSKSYQLMKALSFFSSNYKNPGDSSEGVDVEALKNSVATAVAVGGSARSLDSLSSNTIAGSTGERFQDLAPAASQSVRSQSNNTTVVPTPSSSSTSTTTSSSKTTTST
ncbi:proteoglycan 4 isoform X3 [Anopheles merus]|uniref:proteoglycan 4 isoform X3 n=1 Tax=Anopheles merus TaxID=30066 RepID=UPI001BE3E0A3|nr:proteoglycan 4 isoform X3 [Anopheles merus]